MEKEGAVRIWRRSVHKYKLRYTSMIADGDSSTYPTKALWRRPPLMDKLVRCEKEKCMKFIHLSDLKSHLESKCTLHAHSVQHFITLDQVLQQPADIPPTQIEMETGGHVVRKIISQSQTPFSLPTGGHVSTRSPKVTN